MAGTEVQSSRKQQYAEIKVRDCVIRLTERCPSSFDLLPEQTKGQQDGGVCPKSVSVVEPIKVSVCPNCREVHAVQMNAVPPRPAVDDEARSVWQDFEIHVTTELQSTGEHEEEITTARDASEMLRAATAALRDVRPVAMSEDHRLIGMVAPDRPSCVLIKRMSDGKVLQELVHEVASDQPANLLRLHGVCD